MDILVMLRSFFLESGSIANPMILLLRGLLTDSAAGATGVQFAVYSLAVGGHSGDAEVIRVQMRLDQVNICVSL
jgi:hypothetical protein